MLAASAVAVVPVAVVVGTAVLLAVGGIIGCTRCLIGWLQQPAAEREAAPAARARLA